MYAIIRDGGHQYRVSEGDVILIERTGMEPGSTVTFGEVLFADGKIGSPVLDGASVEAEVEELVKAKKIHVYKYKRRKNYHRHTGHRQRLTRVRIKSISA